MDFVFSGADDLTHTCQARALIEISGTETLYPGTSPLADICAANISYSLVCLLKLIYTHIYYLFI